MLMPCPTVNSLDGIRVTATASSNLSFAKNSDDGQEIADSQPRLQRP